MKKHLVAGLVAAFALAAPLGAPVANAQNAVEIGVLKCVVAGGVGFIFGSSKALECVFDQAGNQERYSGKISKFGLDIGVTGKAYIAWAVFAPRTNLNPGSLSGTYGGRICGSNRWCWRRRKCPGWRQQFHYPPAC